MRVSWRPTRGLGGVTRGGNAALLSTLPGGWPAPSDQNRVSAGVCERRVQGGAEKGPLPPTPCPELSWVLSVRGRVLCLRGGGAEGRRRGWGSLLPLRVGTA